MREPAAGVSSWAASLPFYYGWVIVSVVFLRTFTTAGAMWTTGILSVPMHDDLGWSRTIIFTGLALRTLGAAVSGIFFGRFWTAAGLPDPSPSSARWLPPCVWVLSLSCRRNGSSFLFSA